MNKDKSSDTERLKAILEAYGTDEDKWSTADKTALEAARTQSPSLDELYKSEKQLDDFLAENINTPSAPSYLMGAILQDAEAVLTQQGSNIRQLFQSFFKASPGLILAACLGIYLGVASPNLWLPSYDVNLDELSVSDTVLDWEFDNGNL
ncbi:MAG: hypothetical protein JKY12_02310 [Sneathiella sp.]|nr:hypothetical protein [Sneathiella sp.]